MLTVIEQRIRNHGPEWVVVWELLSNPYVRRNAPVLSVCTLIFFCFINFNYFYNKTECFETNVLEVKSLKVGDVLEGIVRNHVEFGIFIDIGTGFNALAHSSTLLSVVPEVKISFYQSNFDDFEILFV